MLKPAIIYKDVIEKKFMEYLYTNDYFWYSGYGACNELPEIKLSDGCYQWAVVDTKENVIGYFAYRIETGTDTVLNFGLFSFDRGNPLIGMDVYNKLSELIKDHRRLEWRMIGGNPVKRHYDSLCSKFGGNCVCLHDVTKDNHGEWHNEYIYEIVNRGI
jgi:hypothetical protein